MKKNHLVLELNTITKMLIDEFILQSNKNLTEDDLLLEDIDDIRESLDEVDEANIIINRLGRFPLFFKNDTRIYLNKTLKYGILTEHELLEVGKLLDTIKNIIIFDESLKNYEITANRFDFYSNLLVYNKSLNLRIKEIVNNFGEILDTASVELGIIRKNIGQVKKQVQSKLVEIVNSNSSKLTSTNISIRNDRYVIAVKNDYKNQIKGLTHDISSSGETVFIEPMIIVELNNKLNQYIEDEKEEIQRILKEISLRISEDAENLKYAYELIEKLDVIFGKASLASKYDGRKVKVNDEGRLELINCFHPLLNVEKIVKNNFIVNNKYKLDKDKNKYSYNGVIITGPNTGGKTVLLKTIGLLSLMVKMGLLLPCSDESNVAIFDDVYADIGDEQSINQNLSTFSAHLTNIINIINNVSSNSLVILDELGSGTDPTEGASLAISIFDYLIGKKCLVVATSHYPEMKIHAFESNNILNASVEFDINTLKPTYKLLMGIPGESNALKISKILGLPDEIIDNAKNRVSSNSDEINDTLSKLTNQTQVLESKLNEIRDKEYRLNKKLEEANNVILKATKEREKILDNAKVEADKLVKTTLEKAEQLIEELDELKEKSAIKNHEIAKLKYDLKSIKNVEAEEEIPKPIIKKDIVVGDKVHVNSYNTNGVVIKINKDKYSVSIGNATINTTLSDLVYTDEEVKERLIKRQAPSAPRKTVMLSLDLRGMRYEDADPLIDDYLSDARYANLKTVTIIHGFGTGVIRELVQNKVKNSPHVQEFRYGGEKEGGRGVTVVTLK